MDFDDKDRRWKVYVHTNIVNGKRYVGITSRDTPERRWQSGRGYNENTHFKSAIDKYGWDCFKHEVIFENMTSAEAKAKERELIAEWKTQDTKFGYNMTSGGDGTPDYHPSPETRAKLSECRKRENLSEETRRRKSEAMHNRKLSDEHKKRIGIGNSKPILMLDMLGNVIRRFNSAREAENELNISHTGISNCCHGKLRTAGGYMWKFAC